MTETLDKIYLEISNITHARNRRELEAAKLAADIQSFLYDSYPLATTKRGTVESRIFILAQKIEGILK